MRCQCRGDSRANRRGGLVLFSVTPNDKDQALDHIWTALGVYLHLPSSPMADVSLSSSIEVQRLAANIDHLNGQLQFASATMQMQDHMINQQQRILDSRVLIESVQQPEESGAETLPG